MKTKCKYIFYSRLGYKFCNYNKFEANSEVGLNMYL